MALYGHCGTVCLPSSPDGQGFCPAVSLAEAEQQDVIGALCFQANEGDLVLYR